MSKLKRLINVRRRFSINLELVRIDDYIEKFLLKNRQEFTPDEFGYDEFDAEKILSEVPKQFSKHIKLVINNYKENIRSPDIAKINTYIAKKSKKIIKICNPENIYPASLSTYDKFGQSFDSYKEYSNNWKKLKTDFNKDIQLLQQCIDNTFLRNRRRDRQIWIPIIISFISLVVSIVSIMKK